MSVRLRQCLRLSHVRSIQHGLAALAAEQAHRQATALQGSAEHLARLRSGFAAEPGLTSGAALASIGEMAMRLDVAREGLAKPIDAARDRAAITHEARLDARRRQESAERLGEKAAKAAVEAEEKKQAARPKRRSQRLDGELQ